MSQNPDMRIEWTLTETRELKVLGCYWCEFTKYNDRFPVFHLLLDLILGTLGNLFCVDREEAEAEHLP